MSFEQVIVFIAIPIAGYLLGSVPFAWVIGKAHGVDIRTVGSKNIGATNLGRMMGKRYFWQAFLLDAAKGFLPVLVTALLVRHGFESTLRADGHQMGLNDMLNPDLPRTHSHATLPAWSPLVTAIACV